MKILKGAYYLFLPLILGSIVGFLIKDNIDYNMIIKPPLAPPSIVFPIAWTTIYFLLGLSYYFYRKQDLIGRDKISLIYYIELIVNLLWSVIFFILKWRGFACLWIIFLDIFLIYLLSLFYKRKRISFYLNIPYLLWILFATYLTFGIFILN